MPKPLRRLKPLPMTKTKLLLWDWVVRSTHWLIAAGVFSNYFLLEHVPHRWVGYSILGLLGVRLIWGGIAPQSRARLAALCPAPRAILQDLRDLPRREMPAKHGHTPLGSVMIITLWCLLISLGITGWMQGTDRYFGEEWLMDLHHQLADALMLSVALHIAAIVLLGFWKRKSLIRAMLWG